MTQAKTEAQRDQCEKHPWARHYNPDCDHCNGDGYYEEDEGIDGLPCKPYLAVCWECNGRGTLPWLQCEECEWDFHETQCLEEHSI